MDWREYQRAVADHFSSLGCDVQVECPVRGARAEHIIDVWVTFSRFGILCKWAVECKYWSTSVTKEKVLALQAIVSDVGADRGLLVSESGFQTGAIEAAANSSTSLTSLEQIHQRSHSDLMKVVVENIERRLLRITDSLHAVWKETSRNDHDVTLSPPTGVDGQELLRRLANTAVLEMGIRSVKLEKGSFAVEFNSAGNRVIAVHSIEAFCRRATAVLDKIEDWYRQNCDVKIERPMA